MLRWNVVQNSCNRGTERLPKVLQPPSNRNCGEKIVRRKICICSCLCISISICICIWIFICLWKLEDSRTKQNIESLDFACSTSPINLKLWSLPSTTWKRNFCSFGGAKVIVRPYLRQGLWGLIWKRGGCGFAWEKLFFFEKNWVGRSYGDSCRGLKRTWIGCWMTTSTKEAEAKKPNSRCQRLRDIPRMRELPLQPQVRYF